MESGRREEVHKGGVLFEVGTVSLHVKSNLKQS